MRFFATLKNLLEKKEIFFGKVVFLCMPLISRIQISSYFYNLIFSKVTLKGKR
jgi:hypothetical protein